MKDDDQKFQLPAASLKLDETTLKIIESSQVKKFIGPLIVKVHAQGLRKIAVLSWDSDEESRKAAQILAIAFSQQLDRKCALVIAEGIRFNCEHYDCFSLVTLPEIESPTFSNKLDAFVEDLDANYPFQILVGPSIKSWGASKMAKSQMVLNSDAQILLMPSSGFSRTVAMGIDRFTQEQKIKWLGIVELKT